MFRTTLIFAVSLLLPLALGLAGCTKPASQTAPEQDTQLESGDDEGHMNHQDAGQSKAGHEHANHDHADHVHGDHAQQGADDAEITAALAKLSPEDRSLAEQQKTCPVSDELLGSMGPPLKVDVNDHVVFLCCEGCKEDLMADPDKYLAKLNK